MIGFGPLFIRSIALATLKVRYLDIGGWVGDETGVLMIEDEVISPELRREAFPSRRLVIRMSSRFDI